MNPGKTIALVANTSWSIYNFRLGLIRFLIKRGFHVIVIAPRDNFTASLIAEGIDYHQIRIDNYGTNPLGEIKLFWQLRNLYKKLKPDLIFHYTIKPNIYGTFAATMCGIPSVIITTGLGHLFEFKNFLVRRISLILYTYACYLSRETWFLNSNDMDVFVYNGIASEKKSKLLKSEGINLEWFSPKLNHSRTSEIRFLFAGRLLQDKGVEEYVEAAKILKQKFDGLEFQILGFVDESNPNSIPYRKVTEWQDQGIIIYLGETTDVRPYLSNCSCVVFPSYYREGISRILMEAAAMEIPIITTDNVGCREVVDDNLNGFICEPRSTNELVKALIRFIETDEADKILMGKLGRKKMEREFDEHLVLQSYDRAIQRIFKGGIVVESKSKTVQKVT